MPKHIVILGAGPGGYVAAIRAAQLGARVTVIESHALGGVCLNWGCIPSKALLSVVELGDKVKKSEDMGLLVQGPVTYDLARMVARKNKVVATLVKGIATLFKAWNIEQVQGTGSLRDRQTVTVTAADGSVRDLQADAKPGFLGRPDFGWSPRRCSRPTAEPAAGPTDRPGRTCHSFRSTDSSCLRVSTSWISTASLPVC